MNYNFARIHQTLKMTPAMKAGIAARPWTIDEIIALADFKLTQYRLFRKSITPRKPTRASAADRGSAPQNQVALRRVGIY
jgi:hypothetical protein